MSFFLECYGIYEFMTFLQVKSAFDQNNLQEAPMNLSKITETVSRTSVLLLLVMAVPAFAGSQDKKPKAPTPAPKASNPSQKPSTASQKPCSDADKKKSTPGCAPVQAPSGATSQKPVVNNKPVGNNEPALNKPVVNRPQVREVKLSHGTAQIRNGRISSIDSNEMHIERNLNNVRTVVSERSGGVRVVTTGKQGGYVQRPYLDHAGHPYVDRAGHPYYSRTYYNHGVHTTGVYRGYNYGGRTYYSYYPALYYRSAFYAWGYNPWPGPVYWGLGAWGWGGAPWYGFYGGYFTPYSSYASPAYWLTDYLIASSLQAAYAAQTGDQQLQASDAVGTRWIEEESGVPSTWTRRGTSNVFDAIYPTIGVTTVNTVTVSDNKVYIARSSGSDGNLCSYDGTVGPDGASITGTYTCRNGSALWKATMIRDSTPPSADGPPPQAASNAVTLTPEVKEAIAEEVKAQLAAEQAAAGQSGQGASSGVAPTTSKEEVPPALDPTRHTFVVSTDLAVVADGQECALTSGDVITRLTDSPDADQKVNVFVTSSKKTDCASGKQVAVSVDDLQEMYNHFQEQLTNGMGELAKKQGTGGIPKAPDTGTTASNVPPPPPDNTAAKSLQDQQQAADQTEDEVKRQASATSASGQL
jgi:hypothetical protein